MYILEREGVFFYKSQILILKVQAILTLITHTQMANSNWNYSSMWISISVFNLYYKIMVESFNIPTWYMFNFSFKMKKM